MDSTSLVAVFGDGSLFTTIQGVSAIENIVGKPHVVNHNHVPAACFTHPEIAFVGLSEEQGEMKERGRIHVTVLAFGLLTHVVTLFSQPRPRLRRRASNWARQLVLSVPTPRPWPRANLMVSFCR